MANRLAQETSPYLLQHAGNPVDWHPWGADALAKAREGDKPILLSIGYSACHWCHVMEHESFEDPATAAYMNERFVPVKVDREERPDLDALYMEFVQATTGHGGWPLTAFLAPDGTPFYGGTYFPPEPRAGMPSFRQLMEAISEAWGERRGELEGAAERTREALGATARRAPSTEPIEASEVRAAAHELRGMADLAHGGFGGAPKFPPASALEFLLGQGINEPAERTLDAMACGGIYDQLGGGFHRYAVDAVWLVPHFEKMLYDNALLARAYLHGWQKLGHERYRRICTETLDWALREMRGPEGGFYAALDADSEGEEGLHYVWTAAELHAALGDRAAEATAFWGVSEQGNFEDGRNVLHLSGGPDAEPPAKIEETRRTLLAIRERRPRPGLDDKRICSWNALMIGALAEAGAALGEDRYLDAARECAGFVLETLRDPDGRLLRTYKDGEAKLDAYLEDHAFCVEALITLFEASCEERWYEAARELAGAMITRFADPERGGFFTTAHDAEQLVARRKDAEDHPIPSGNSAAAYGLLRLWILSGEQEYERHALGALRLLREPALRHPHSFAHALQAMALYADPGSYPPPSCPVPGRTA